MKSSSGNSSGKGGRPSIWIGGGGLDSRKLADLGVAQLRQLFQEVWGVKTTSNNSAWLRRKLSQPPAAQTASGGSNTGTDATHCTAVSHSSGEGQEAAPEAADVPATATAPSPRRQATLAGQSEDEEGLTDVEMPDGNMAALDQRHPAPAQCPSAADQLHEKLEELAVKARLARLARYNRYPVSELTADLLARDVWVFQQQANIWRAGVVTQVDLAGGSIWVQYRSSGDAAEPKQLGGQQLQELLAAGRLAARPAGAPAGRREHSSGKARRPRSPTGLGGQANAGLALLDGGSDALPSRQAKLRCLEAMQQSTRALESGSAHYSSAWDVAEPAYRRAVPARTGQEPRQQRAGMQGMPAPSCGPSSIQPGRSDGAAAWRQQPGQWHRLQQLSGEPGAAAAQRTSSIACHSTAVAGGAAQAPAAAAACAAIVDGGAQELRLAHKLAAVEHAVLHEPAFWLLMHEADAGGSQGPAAGTGPDAYGLLHAGRGTPDMQLGHHWGLHELEQAADVPDYGHDWPLI